MIKQQIHFQIPQSSAIFLQIQYISQYIIKSNLFVDSFSKIHCEIDSFEFSYTNTYYKNLQLLINQQIIENYAKYININESEGLGHSFFIISFLKTTAFYYLIQTYKNKLMVRYQIFPHKQLYHINDIIYSYFQNVFYNDQHKFFQFNNIHIYIQYLSKIL
ncbi:hypothetical protein pb186bvf_012123 [Paramecium bursaria]